MIEHYLFIGANVLILFGAYFIFSLFTESCRAIHAKIVASEKATKAEKKNKSTKP